MTDLRHTLNTLEDRIQAIDFQLDELNQYRLEIAERIQITRGKLTASRANRYTEIMIPLTRISFPYEDALGRSLGINRYQPDTLNDANLESLEKAVDSILESIADGRDDYLYNF